MRMRLIRRSFRSTAGVLVAIFALAIVSQSQDLSNQQTPAIKIKNFGQMDERFYRGGQPREDDYKGLAAIGIQTVIDLTDDPKEYEKAAVESLGMKYIHIPMIAKKYPTAEATRMFLAVAGNPATGKFFLHCAGGRHRTGAMGAVYRYQFYHWNFEQVYKEMKQYDFYTSWGHGAFKDFVKDYYQQMQTTRAAAQSAPASDSFPIHTQEKR